MKYWETEFSNVEKDYTPSSRNVGLVPSKLLIYYINRISSKNQIILPVVTEKRIWWTPTPINDKKKKKNSQQTRARRELPQTGEGIYMLHHTCWGKTMFLPKTGNKAKMLSPLRLGKKQGRLTLQHVLVVLDSSSKARKASLAD